MLDSCTLKSKLWTIKHIYTSLYSIYTLATQDDTCAVNALISDEPKLLLMINKHWRQLMTSSTQTLYSRIYITAYCTSQTHRSFRMQTCSKYYSLYSDHYLRSHGYRIFCIYSCTHAEQMTTRSRKYPLKHTMWSNQPLWFIEACLSHKTLCFRNCDSLSHNSDFCWFSFGFSSELWEKRSIMWETVWSVR